MRGSGRAVRARPGIPGRIANQRSLDVGDNLGSCISNVFEIKYLKVSVSKLVEINLYMMNSNYSIINSISSVWSRDIFSA
jgi:hypothetical protein